MSYLTKKKRKGQRLLDEMLTEYYQSENKFPVIDYKGKFNIPILSKNGIVNDWEEYEETPKGFKGHVLEINGHGNVTVWNYFKNGTIREVASRV